MDAEWGHVPDLDTYEPTCAFCNGYRIACTTHGNIHKYTPATHPRCDGNRFTIPHTHVHPDARAEDMHAPLGLNDDRDVRPA